MAANAWAQPADVMTYTGKTVTEAQCNYAQVIVEIHSNRTLAGSGSMSTRDTTWLKKAVAFQAAWMAQQIEQHGRVEVTNLSQDGLSMAYADGDAINLAPLARRCISRCSWAKSRAVRIEPEWVTNRVASLVDALDDEGNWTPL